MKNTGSKNKKYIELEGNFDNIVEQVKNNGFTTVRKAQDEFEVHYQETNGGYKFGGTLKKTQRGARLFDKTLSKKVIASFDPSVNARDVSVELQSFRKHSALAEQHLEFALNELVKAYEKSRDPNVKSKCFHTKKVLSHLHKNSKDISLLMRKVAGV